MRKAMFFIFVVVGAAVGLASALTDDWGVKAVMMTIGAVTGAAIGGAISGITARGRKKLRFDSEALPGLGIAPTDMMDNYWRDKGRSPLTSALEKVRFGGRPCRASSASNIVKADALFPPYCSAKRMNIAKL